MDSAHANRPVSGGNSRPGLAHSTRKESMLRVASHATRATLKTLNAWNRVAIWPSGAPWLASCCRLETPFRKKKLCSKRQFDGLRVVLVNTRNPLNIGAAARAMSNFGFLHLRVVNPFELAFREARSAVGAAPLLAQAEEFKSLAEAIG